MVGRNGTLPAASSRVRCLASSCIALCLVLLGTHSTGAQQAFRVLMPPGNMPHPAVLLVPGCSGFRAKNGIDHYKERAAELQAIGYVVVFVDYVGRRMQTNCAHISQAEVANDILEAITSIRGETGIDATRISLIGWSYGGGGVLAALQILPPSLPIAKAVMYYPVCRGAVPWSAAVAGLMLLGGKDDIAYPSLCNAVMRGVPTDRLKVINYPEARHGFDVRGLPEHADPLFGAPAYNAEVAIESWAAVLDFLK